ncbi:MAG: hypothetical protein EA378_09665 [Phycisphaerales bacterium]|nr:MAG: hypothetical protein EA378_09665 [Phycisphaerales bacterium]
MLRRVNTTRRRHAPRSGLVRLCIAVFGLLAAAPTGALPGAAASEPDPVLARSGFDAVRMWVERGAVPERGEVGFDVAPDLGPEVSAVAVTLRASGAVVGRGQAVRASGQAPALIAAARAAVREARERGHYEPGELGELVRPGERLAITLELAGPMIPMQPSEVTDAAALLRPGIDGVAFRIGNRQVARFPAQLLRTRTLPSEAIPALIAELSGDAALGLRDPVATAQRLQGRFFRFRTLHLAQPTAGAEPLFLHRGGRIVRSGEVNTGALRAFAEGLAGHLIAREWTGPDLRGMFGGYEPILGDYEPPVATDLDQATTAFALLRFANRAGAMGLAPGDARAVEARRVAMSLLRRFTTREGLGRLEDPVLSAMVAVALVEAGARLDEDRGDLAAFDRALLVCANVLRESYSPAGGFVRTVPSQARALVAFGLTGVAEASGRFTDLTRAEGAAASVLRETAPGQLAGEMPWLGWAAVRAAGWRAADEPLPQGEGLRQLRADVWLHQLTPNDLDAIDADLAGGIVFTAGAAPLPSWHAVRPLAFLATMLGDPRLTDEQERMPELVRLMSSLRFLLQLSAQAAEGHMYADPSRARWGVRSSPWDQRMPVQASALTLLVVVETLASLDRLSGGPRAEPPRPD